MQTAVTLARNIARARREQGLTQEELASFLGVTKASVSKWERAQSCPDIELLPRIAARFGMTIDELVGYAPEMSKQELRATCERLRQAFAELPFEEAHELCQGLVRDYYTAYPLLVQIAALYVNHFDLAPADERAALVEETVGLCRRVRVGCDSSAHVRQAESIEALCLLGTGDAQGVVDLVGDTPCDMGTDIVYAHALTALGQTERAEATLQANLFQSIVTCLSRLPEMAMLRAGEPGRLKLCHRRALALIDAFDLESVFLNVAAVHLTFAAAYMGAGDAEGALECLAAYERACRAMEFPVRLHGDVFFDRIEQWAQEMIDIGTDAPREEALVRRSMLSSVADNPAFASLAEDARFQRIVASLAEVAR